MEVGTAKEQTLASIRELVSGDTYLDYYYAKIRSASNFAATAVNALSEKRPDDFGDYRERAVADWHAFLNYAARQAVDYTYNEQRLAGMSAELWEEIGMGIGLGEVEVASRIEADGRSVQSLESVRERKFDIDWMKRHIGKM